MKNLSEQEKLDFKLGLMSLGLCPFCQHKLEEGYVEYGFYDGKQCEVMEINQDCVGCHTSVSLEIFSDESVRLESHILEEWEVEEILREKE